MRSTINELQLDVRLRNEMAGCQITSDRCTPHTSHPKSGAGCATGGSEFLEDGLGTIGVHLFTDAGNVILALCLRGHTRELKSPS